MASRGRELRLELPAMPLAPPATRARRDLRASAWVARMYSCSLVFLRQSRPSSCPFRSTTRSGRRSAAARHPGLPGRRCRRFASVSLPAAAAGASAGRWPGPCTWRTRRSLPRRPRPRARRRRTTRRGGLQVSYLHDTSALGRGEEKKRRREGCRMGPSPRYAALAAACRETPPQAVVILGSGMGAAALRVRPCHAVPFAECPGLPAASVKRAPRPADAGGTGPAGGAPLFEGRLHRYEGRSWTTWSGRFASPRNSGAPVAVLTNAAGGIRADLAPGALMAVDATMSNGLITRAAPARPRRDRGGHGAGPCAAAGSAGAGGDGRRHGRARGGSTPGADGAVLRDPGRDPCAEGGGSLTSSACPPPAKSRRRPTPAWSARPCRSSRTARRVLLRPLSRAMRRCWRSRPPRPAGWPICWNGSWLSSGRTAYKCLRGPENSNRNGRGET